MNRRQFWQAVGLAVLASARPVEGRTLKVEGRLTATDQEAREGYFGVGQHVMITVRPGTTEHEALRGMVGQDVSLFVV